MSGHTKDMKSTPHTTNTLRVPALHGAGIFVRSSTMVLLAQMSKRANYPIWRQSSLVLEARIVALLLFVPWRILTAKPQCSLQSAIQVATLMNISTAIRTCVDANSPTVSSVPAYKQNTQNHPGIFWVFSSLLFSLFRPHYSIPLGLTC